MEFCYRRSNNSEFTSGLAQLHVCLSMFLRVPHASEVSYPYISSFLRPQMKFLWRSSSQSNSKRRHQASASSPGYKDARFVRHALFQPLHWTPASSRSPLSWCLCRSLFSWPPILYLMGFLFSSSIVFCRKWLELLLIALYFLPLALISLEHALVFPLVCFVDDRSRGKHYAWVFRLI